MRRTLLPRMWIELAVPAAALMVCLSLVLGLASSSAQQHWSQGLEVASLLQLRDRLHRDLLRTLALATLVVVPVWGLVLRRPPGTTLRRAAALTLLVGTLGLATLSRAGLAVTERVGLVLPSDLWWAIRRFEMKGEVPRIWLALAALLALALLTLVWSSRRSAGRREGSTALWSWWPRCVGASFAVVLLGLASVDGTLWMKKPAAEPGARNVVFLTWDSLRADHLSLYGYERSTTPALERLAADSVLFENALSQHNWTRPSYSTYLTGRYRWELENDDLGPTAVTMAEILQNAGYRTLGIVQNPMLDPNWHFDQGFEYYHQVYFDPSPRAVNRRVAEHLEKNDGRPLFLFIHYLRPHFPYVAESTALEKFRAGRPAPLTANEVNRLLSTHGRDAPELSPEQIQYVRDLYDATILNTDSAFGELLQLLDRHLDPDKTIVVFNSDHGDEFEEHGSFGHAHQNLHGELIGVPLLLRVPSSLGVTPGRVAEPVMNLDVVPTILELLGQEPPTPLTGQSLVPLLRRAEPGKSRILLSTSGQQLALREGPYKLIVDGRGEDADLLYDLRSDPGEQHPLENPESHPAFRRLRELADLWYARRGPDAAATDTTVDATTDAALRAQLELLGYVEEKD